MWKLKIEWKWRPREVTLRLQTETKHIVAEAKSQTNLGKHSQSYCYQLLQKDTEKQMYSP